MSKSIKNIFKEPGIIRFFFFLIILVSGYMLDEKFNTLIFFPIAFIIEGLIVLKYKSFFFYDISEGGLFFSNDFVISDNTKFPGIYAIYWGIILLLIGTILITLFFTKGITLDFIFS